MIDLSAQKYKAIKSSKQQIVQWDISHAVIRYSPVTTSHTRDLSRVVPRVIQREEKICHA